MAKKTSTQTGSKPKTKKIKTRPDTAAPKAASTREQRREGHHAADQAGHHDSGHAHVHAHDRAHDRAPVLRRSFWMFWILLIGFALRAWHLTDKPIHFDEGINGHFVETIWRDGFYRYDPTNFHGPLYFYILALAERIFGFGIFSFRFVTGLIGLAAVWLIGRHRRFVGASAIWAALIMAVSTACVFYSRYSIHESLFIFSQIAFSYGFFLYREEKSNASLWWMALAIVGMATTKETFFVYLGTWAIAVVGLNLFDRFVPRFRTRAYGFETLNGAPPTQNFIAISLVSIVLILALFTGFFIYIRGAVDMIAAFNVWAKTGTEHSGHEKVFVYYFDLMRRFEWPCLIGLIATPIVFFFARRPLRILTLVGFGTWLAYSLIPYKTPWLILNVLWPLSFTAGAVIARVIPPFSFWRGLRTGLALATFIAIFVSISEMVRLSYKDFAKVGEPYVYVQTTEECKRATDILLKHLKRRPEDSNMRILAMNRDLWPMPYVLIPFSNVAWGHSPETPLVFADVVLSDSEDRVSIESRLVGKYFVLPFQIRDSYQPGQVYLNAEKFAEDVPTGTDVFEKVVKP